MANFSFLNDVGQEDNGFYAAGAANKKPTAGPQYTPLSEDTGRGEEAGQGPDSFGASDQPRPANPAATIKNQSSLRQAKENALKEYGNVVNHIASKSNIQSPEAGNILGLNPGTFQFNPDEWMERASFTHPSDYYGLAQKAAQRGGVPDAPMGPLEDAVTAYNKLSADPNSGELEDHKQSQAQYDDMEKQKEALLDRAKFGPKEKRQQYTQQAGEIQQKQALLGDKTGIRSAGGAPQQGQPGDMTMPFQPPPIDTNLDLDALWTAAGVKRDEPVKAMVELRRMAMLHGIQPTDKVTPSTFPVVYNNMIAEFMKPEVQRMMFEDIARREKPQPKGDEGNMVPTNAQQDPNYNNVNMQIHAKEMRQQQVWQELAHSDTFKNVGDVIGFVVTSLLLGPRAASLFFSNMQKNGNLRWELDRLDHETTNLYHQQNNYIHLAQQARHQAAMEKETQAHNWEMEGYQYGRLKAMAGKITDPETKAVAQAKLHGSRLLDQQFAAEGKAMATKKDDLARLEKIASTVESTDPQHEDAVKRLPAARSAYAADQATYMSKLRAYQKYKSELSAWLEKNSKKIGTMPGQPGGTPLEEGTFDQ